MTTLIALTIFFLAAGLLLRNAVSAAQLKAQFKLFAVRDALVYLVAAGDIAEENPVFDHYYARLNGLLRQTPNVGIDDLLQAILNYKGDSKQFDKALETAEIQIERLKRDKAMSVPSVAETIAQYYEGIQFLILTHSNWAKIMVYLFRIPGMHAEEMFKKILPKEALEASKTFRFAQQERQHIANNVCHI